jgi:hypothetical protein
MFDAGSEQFPDVYSYVIKEEIIYAYCGGEGSRLKSHFVMLSFYIFQSYFPAGNFLRKRLKM